jgi:hypothetical protein
VRVAPATKAAGAGGVAQTVIPMAAVLYDEKGATWAYTKLADRTYVRQPVAVARIDGDFGVLTSGPAAGTAVVTLGAAELLGAELGIEGD